MNGRVSTELTNARIMTQTLLRSYWSQSTSACVMSITAMAQRSWSGSSLLAEILLPPSCQGRFLVMKYVKMTKPMPMSTVFCMALTSSTFRRCIWHSSRGCFLSTGYASSAQNAKDVPFIRFRLRCNLMQNAQKSDHLHVHADAVLS